MTPASIGDDTKPVNKKNPASLPRRNVIPELTMLGLLVAALIGLDVIPCHITPRMTPPPGTVELAVPTARFIAGVGPLSPGDFVTLKVFAPELSAFKPLCLPHVQVRALDNQDKGSAVLAIPHERVSDLEAAVASDKVHLSYHLERADSGDVDGGVLDTCPQPPQAATPAPCPTPSTNYATLELPASSLQPRAQDLHALGGYRLIIATPAPDRKAVTTCVLVKGFVGAGGKLAPAYVPGKTPSLRVQLPSENAPTVAAALIKPEGMWMLPDTACPDPATDAGTP